MLRRKALQRSEQDAEALSMSSWPRPAGAAFESAAKSIHASAHFPNPRHSILVTAHNVRPSSCPGNIV